MPTRITLTLLLTLTVLFSATGQIDYDKYRNPTKATKQKAKASATDWLDKYAAKNGIPTNLKLGKLLYRTNEITFSPLEDLYAKNPNPTQEQIQEAVKRTESMEMYNYFIEYNNYDTDLYLQIHFEFDYRGENMFVKVSGDTRRCFNGDGQLVYERK